jgi:hypothetical protein
VVSTIWTSSCPREYMECQLEALLEHVIAYSTSGWHDLQPIA